MTPEQVATLIEAFTDTFPDSINYQFSHVVLADFNLGHGFISKALGGANQYLEDEVDEALSIITGYDDDEYVRRKALLDTIRSVNATKLFLTLLLEIPDEVLEKVNE